MPTQTIDLATIDTVTYDGNPISSIVLDGTEIYPVVTGEDVTSSFRNIGEYLVTDGASDTNANYSVSEVQVDATGSKRLYIGHKSTATTTYYSDAPIAAVQILNSSGTTVLHNYWFGGNQNQGWASTTSGVSAGTTGLSMSPTAASGYSYSSITANSTTDSFGLATSTGSSSTGATDGIANPSGPMTVGNVTIPQYSNTYYAYREASGSTLNYAVFMRSPAINWTKGMKVRVAYIIGNHPSTRQEVDDTLFIGIY